MPSRVKNSVRGEEERGVTAPMTSMIRKKRASKGVKALHPDVGVQVIAAFPLPMGGAASKKGEAKATALDDADRQAGIEARVVTVTSEIWRDDQRPRALFDRAGEPRSAP